MEDFITVLLDYLSEQRRATADSEYFARLAEENAAFEALQNSFTREQHKLFLAYEDARNACDSVSDDAYARAAFLLAREIYR